MATEGEEAVKDGRTKWEYLCKLQRVYAGRRPVRATKILKNDGQLTKGPEEVLEHWYQHFRKVLNVQAVYDHEVIFVMPALELMLHLENPSSMEELEARGCLLFWELSMYYNDVIKCHTYTITYVYIYIYIYIYIYSVT